MYHPPYVRGHNYNNFHHHQYCWYRPNIYVILKILWFVVSVSLLVFDCCSVMMLISSNDNGDNSSRGIRTIPLIHAKEFKVALWGDLPYHGKSENIFDTKDSFGTIYQDFRNSINDHVKNNGVVVSFHTGDIKSGSTPCIPLYYNRFIDLANSLNVPTLVTMGDNEWTDCYRSQYNPIERLRYTRTRLYNNQTTSSSSTTSTTSTTSRLGGGKPISISSFGPFSQPYIENQYIIRDGIIFALLHVTGSNNNFRDHNCDDRLHVIDPYCAAANAEYVARDNAVTNALSLVFQKAKQQQLRGIMIIIQAHFWGGNTEQCNALGISVTTAESSVSSGYKNFMKRFMEEVSEYHNMGDVVVVHGDAHYYRNCYPTIYNNVAFVMVPGSADISWVLATIDSDQSINNIFTFQHIDRPFQPIQLGPVPIPPPISPSKPMIPSVSVHLTPTTINDELCTIKYKVYDGKTNAFFARIVANEKIQNPPCHLNIEVVIICSNGRRVTDKSIRITLRRVVDMKVIHARTEVGAPYFLFGNNGTDIYEGTTIGQARYQIRVRSFDTELNAKLPKDGTQFRLDVC